MVKKFLLPLLTTLTLISVSTVAKADTLVSNGSGGDYSYELWQDNTRYYLKIWKRESYGKEDAYTTSSNFESSQEALEHFDCYYGDKSLPACPK
ncbi:MAG: hypothetical protein C6Y22_17000 [Hapalosiphonaceae cyanobacterium JJU2]|nr:MAG: hypothetical protein C6Y22_17000 [Hapalosiphonaceae cyanobacterium JJU2]TBR60829.1 hypothetical protein B4U84_08310 [Westiellopsis prolifica IICB1]